MAAFHTGLTSVTFRQKSAAQIAALAAEAGLEGIEWGGDVHVPPGDAAAAASAARLTREAGLRVTSYGSYYHALPQEDFAPVLRSAAALGAPVVRIWAGDRPWEQLSEDVYKRQGGPRRTPHIPAAFTRPCGRSRCSCCPRCAGRG